MEERTRQKIQLLKDKFLRIEKLEKEITPKGVNFSLRGQEKLTLPEDLENVEAAANDVINALEKTKELSEDRESVESAAIY